MFCSNCGKEISEDTAFCSNCGAKQKKETAEPVNAPNINVPVANQTDKPRKKGGLTAGWIMAVLGGLSVFGAIANGTYANFSSLGMTMSDFFMVAIQIALIGFGIYLIYKNKK